MRAFLFLAEVPHGSGPKQASWSSNPPFCGAQCTDCVYVFYSCGGVGLTALYEEIARNVYACHTRGSRTLWVRLDAIHISRLYRRGTDKSFGDCNPIVVIQSVVVSSVGYAPAPLPAGENCCCSRKGPSERTRHGLTGGSFVLIQE